MSGLSSIPLEFRSTFDTINDLKIVWKAFALRNGCRYVVVKSSKERYEIACPNEEGEGVEKCRFRLTAFRKRDGLVHISKANVIHSVFCESSSEKYRISSNTMVSEVEHLCHTITNIKPKDLSRTVKRDFGVDLNYHTAWKTLNLVKKKPEKNKTSLFLKSKGFLMPSRKRTQVPWLRWKQSITG